MKVKRMDSHTKPVLVCMRDAKKGDVLVYRGASTPSEELYVRLGVNVLCVRTNNLFNLSSFSDTAVYEKVDAELQWSLKK